MTPQQPQAPNSQTALKTVDEILHGVVFAAVLAAGVFVKNPNSQAMATKLSQLAVELLQGFDAQVQKLTGS